MLSLSNLTPGIMKRSMDYRIASLNDQQCEYEENKKSIYDEEREASTALMPQYEDIFFREDLFEYLLQKGLDNKSAYALMNKVSKEECNPHRFLSYMRFFYHYENLDKEFYEWAER